MTEKTNAEVLEDSTEEDEVPQPVVYNDKLVLLDNSSLLITRIMPTKGGGGDPDPDTFICMYKPLEIFADAETGEVMVRDWIPESIDDFYFLPVIKVTNVSMPDPFFLNLYHKHIMPTNSNGAPHVLH